MMPAMAFAMMLAAEPDSLLQWMDRIAQRQLQAREAEVAAVRTVADAERRKKVVRARILDALGGLPDYSGPLNAKVTGSVQADGYVIEKVVYESLPGYYVTANVYRPAQPGRYPAVLLQSGHTQEGKVEPQLLAANLALKGFVSLAFDPAGQGEREQTYDPNLDGAVAGWSVPEHIHAGAQAALAGESATRYFIWDAQRSLDYLAARPDVDPDRIGAAGCSGGGALTTFVGALDARLKAVVPACFPVSYRVLFTGDVPHAEMLVPGELARGLDTADFVELSAPVPWLIQATEGDFFPPAGARMVYEEARRWYGLYGAQERVALFVGPGPHGTPLASREAIYGWLIRWLKDGRGDAREQPVQLYPNHALRATQTGQVGGRKLHELIRDDFLARRKPGTAAGLAAELRRLKIPSAGGTPVVQVLSGTERQKIRFESEPGIALDGELLIPAGQARRPAVLLVGDGRLAEAFARAGSIVLTMAPRTSAAGDRIRPYVGDWLTNTRAELIGLSLPAMRAHDIVRGVDLLAGRADVSSIRAAARGVAGVWLLLAAAADPRIQKIWLDRTPYSYAAALDRAMNVELSEAVIPGFALRWDLQEVRDALGARAVLWTDPTAWTARVAAAGPRFRYRHDPGDLTDMAGADDEAFVKELLQ